MSQVMVPGFSMPATCTGNYKTAVLISAGLYTHLKQAVICSIKSSIENGLAVEQAAIKGWRY